MFLIFRDVLSPPGTISTDHKFTITNYTEPTVCQHCNKLLNGLIHQGYRCSVCKISVHRSCISSAGRCNESSIPIKVNPTPQFQSDVGNHKFSEFYWFVGDMDRDAATTKLLRSKIGTYLLRIRPQGASNETETIYAISLK